MSASSRAGSHQPAAESDSSRSEHGNTFATPSISTVRGIGNERSELELEMSPDLQSLVFLTDPEDVSGNGWSEESSSDSTLSAENRERDHASGQLPDDVEKSDVENSRENPLRKAAFAVFQNFQARKSTVCFSMLACTFFLHLDPK